MSTTITLDDQLTERIAALAADAGESVETFGERMLQGLADADIDLREGIPVFRIPPGAPTPTLSLGARAMTTSHVDVSQYET